MQDKAGENKMNVQPRRNRGRDKVISREIIEECAVNLFKIKGVDKTSINEIVKEAGIAKGTFYLYFNNKDDLADAVISRYTRQFIDQVIIPFQDVPKIIILSDAIINYFAQNRMLLVELRKNLLSGKPYPSTRETVKGFSRIFLNYLNQYEDYHVSNWEVYTTVVLGMILDVCFKSLVEEKVGSAQETKNMLSDLLKRFFSCD
ncbi:MAG: TetR/AcrR family transcriptional regulator [Deltaproteobacteria bacterium]|nr:TetR/AcrR family transcriptional regulator [Deltaproteobacteria bacterium]